MKDCSKGSHCAECSCDTLIADFIVFKAVRSLHLSSVSGGRAKLEYFLLTPALLKHDSGLKRLFLFVKILSS